MKEFKFLGVLALSFFFAACGSDSSSSAEEVPVSSSEESSSSKESSSSVEISSSSEMPSSSSEEASSSEAYIDPHIAWDYLNPALSYGEFTDERDGHVYKTIDTDNKYFRVMAENLVYADSVENPNLKGNTWCPYNNLDSCSKYGRYYSWTAAMNLPAEYATETYQFESFVNSFGYQGICPEGWTIFVSREQWRNLFFPTPSGNELCALKGWNTDKCTDPHGFSALPNGYYAYGEFKEVGVSARHWSLNLNPMNSGDEGTMGIITAGMNDNWQAARHSKADGAAVRCMYMDLDLLVSD